MRKHTYIILCILSLSLLTGCTPKERTVLLPDVKTQTTDEEDISRTDHFTVKNIFTYSYETEAEFEKSAFLKGCEAHKVCVIATEPLENGAIPVSRQVDYRYGFYDSPGIPEGLQEAQHIDTLSSFFSLWKRPEHLEEELTPQNESTLYVPEKLLLSPDGTKMLIYASADYWDGMRIWLYDFETQTSWLLYEGTRSEHALPSGSFSPNGRWVAFDLRGETTPSVAVYDCQKDFPTDDTDPEARTELSILSSLYPPDCVLFPAPETSDTFLEAKLLEFDTQPGILTLFKGKESSIRAIETYLLEDSEGSDAAPSFSQHEYWLYGKFDTIPNPLQYELAPEENRLYYLDQNQLLQNLQLDDGTTLGYQEFEKPVDRFWRLPFGELLTLSCPAQNGISSENELYLNNQSSLILPSADLYLYSSDRTEGQLLYKNLQNVIAMEYDAQNRRILLETVKNESLTKRECLILEM